MNPVPGKAADTLLKCRERIGELEMRKGRPILACVVTFGCQMNARDSEKIRGMLLEAGFQEGSEEDADLILYNTCTVRDHADQRLYGRLGSIKSRKKAAPDLKIALCGCMMQEATARKKIEQSYPEVDLVFGTHNLTEFPELLLSLYQGGGHVVAIRDEAFDLPEFLPTKRTYAFKSGVNIMYGCDNFCSYCIVPYVRGRERSRPYKEILSEIRALADAGVLEVMLLGQNVNSYGKNLEEPLSFAELLRKVAGVDGIERIRFMTSHPKDLSQDLIDVMADTPKICRHLHLPVQSGSSRLLKRMNRNYSREDYLDLIGRIRNKLPDLSLTSDIIVGFPGESDEDFEDTLSLIRLVGFDSVFTFEYSKRSGTRAADFPDPVEPGVVKERFARLLDVVGKTGRESVRRFEGSTRTVLVEERNRTEGLMTGRTSENILVHFPGDDSLLGKLVPVCLRTCKGFYYLGEIKTWPSHQ